MCMCLGIRVLKVYKLEVRVYTQPTDRDPQTSDGRLRRQDKWNDNQELVTREMKRKLTKPKLN